MAIYYQHIGRELWRRDAPRSIGTVESGLLDFRFDDIADALSELSKAEREDIEREADRVNTFQIWGFPSGASRVLRDMSGGDHLMLLESEDFRYVGEVIHYVTEPCWALSGRVWGEERFPLIALLRGRLIEYPWDAFVEDFGFAENYHMRGNTCRLADARVATSRFRTDKQFVEHLLAERSQSAQGDHRG